ncbi:MAG: hypothetical protein ABWZ58_04990 [Acidimicrobiia bacterium]
MSVVVSCSVVAGGKEEVGTGVEVGRAVFAATVGVVDAGAHAMTANIRPTQGAIRARLERPGLVAG